MILGSFVSVVAHRALRGAHRRSGERIQARYLLTELTMAALSATTVLILGADDLSRLARGLALCTLLVTVTLTDLERRVIPNSALLGGTAVGVAFAAAGPPSGLGEVAIAAAGAGGFLLLVALVSPRGMGMGDVKLVAVMGLYLGRAIAPAVLIGFGAGALAGLAVIVRQGVAARKRAVPFGPFLALGGVVGLWYGGAIVDWYLDTFFNG